jgi:hypothetical protein
MQTMEKSYCIIIWLSLLVGNAFAQNEYYGEASRKQVTKVFTVKSDFGSAEFEVHGEPDAELQMKRVQEVLVEHATPIFNYFKYVPLQTIHMRIANSPMRSNGSATVVPRNMVVLNMFPPVGSGYLLGQDDWLKNLILHELVHVIHLEQANGFLKVLTIIMGNAGRLGGLTPRWFSEGLATWAETHFTSGGRLRQQDMLAEAKTFLKRDNFCKTIDCLDNPGEYPFGNISYWVGAAFLDYIEKKNEGTLACIVKANSSRVPFFLRGAFQRCSGEKVELSFTKFKEEFLKEEVPSDSFYKELTKINPYKDGEAVFQRDFQVQGDDLYWVKQYRDSARIMKKNLKSGEVTEEYRDYYVDQLLLAGDTIYSATSRFRRMWVQRDIRLGDDVIGQGDFLLNVKGRGPEFWRYEDKTWRLFNYDNEEVSKLNPFIDVVDVQNNHMILKKDKDFFLYNMETNEQLGSALRPSRLMGVCDGQAIVREMGALIVMNDKSQYRLKNRWTKDVIKMRASNSHVIFKMKSAPTELYHYNKGCGELVALIKKEGQRSNIGSKRIKEITSPKLSTYENKERSYPGIRHFRPHVWFFSFAMTEDYTDATFSTRLNDPLDRHSLSLDFRYHGEISKSVLNGTYSYNLYGTLLGFGSDVDYTSTSRRYEKESQQFIFASRSFFFDRFTYNITLKADKYSEDDVVSNRKGDSQAISQSLSMQPLFTDSFFKGAVLSGLTRFHNVSSSSFTEQNVKLTAKFQPRNRVHTILQGSYGRLNKTSLSDGVLFSGDYNSSYIHEFIGLDSKSSFGNEVTTARAQLDYEVYRLHRGWGFMPAFLRTFNFLAGTDYLKTDYIYVRTNQYLLNSDAKSYYAGLRTKWNFFYFIPVRLDILQVKLDRDGIGSETNTEFFLQADLSF